MKNIIPEEMKDVLSDDMKKVTLGSFKIFAPRCYALLENVIKNNPHLQVQLYDVRDKSSAFKGAAIALTAENGYNKTSLVLTSHRHENLPLTDRRAVKWTSVLAARAGCESHPSDIGAVLAHTTMETDGASVHGLIELVKKAGWRVPENRDPLEERAMVPKKTWRPSSGIDMRN